MLVRQRYRLWKIDVVGVEQEKVVKGGHLRVVMVM